MRRCAPFVSLVAMVFSWAGSTLAHDAPPPPISVLWFSGTLGPGCPVEDAQVAHEVRRIYKGMGIEVNWTNVPDGEAEYHGEVIVIAVAANPLPRPSVMGSASQDSRNAWVYCAAIKEALGLRGPGRREAPLLSRALGRVAAHEIAHVLAPGFGHSNDGLMRARWREVMLREGDLLADAATRRALRAHLAVPDATDGATIPQADLMKAER